MAFHKWLDFSNLISDTIFFYNKGLTREARMDPPIQLLNRLSVDTADEMIFSFMLWKVNKKNQKEALS